MTQILFLGADSSMARLADTASQQGCDVVSLERTQMAEADPQMNVRHELDPLNLSDWINVASSLQPDAVIARAAPFEQFLNSRICSQLDLPGPDCDMIDLVSDRTEFESFLKSLAISVPESKICTSLEKAGEAFRSLGGSVKLQPWESRNAFQPVQIDSLSDFVDAWRAATRAASDDRVLMTRSVPSRVIQIEGIAQDGRFQTIASADCAAESGLDFSMTYPTLLPIVETEVLIEAVRSIVAHLGLDCVYIESEWVLGSEGPMLLAFRTGCSEPGLKASLLKSVYGIDLSQILLDLCLGIPQHIRTDIQGAGLLFRSDAIILEEDNISRIDGDLQYNLQSGMISIAALDHASLKNFVELLPREMSDPVGIARR